MFVYPGDRVHRGPLRGSMMQDRHTNSFAKDQRDGRGLAVYGRSRHLSSERFLLGLRYSSSYGPQIGGCGMGCRTVYLAATHVCRRWTHLVMSRWDAFTPGRSSIDAW
jgi:hypothetical protein